MNDSNEEYDELPLFVKNFLNKKNVKLVPKKNKKSIHRNQIRRINELVKQSNISLIKSFYFLRKVIFNAPAFLQAEYYQLLFPYFIIFAVHEQELTDFINFFNNNKYDFSQDEQNIIQSFFDDPSSFILPKFDCELSEIAVYDLSLHFKQSNSKLLLCVLEEFILSNITEYSLYHRPIGTTSAKIKNVNKESENNQVNNVFSNKQNSSTIYFSTSELNPAIVNDSKLEYEFMKINSNKEHTTDEEGFTSFPNIAHFTLYNHDDKINDIKLSRSAALLGYSQSSSVFINLLDTNFVFPTDEISHKIITQKSRISTIAFSPNSCLISSGSIDGEIRIASTEACREICHYHFHLKPCYDLTFDNNNFLLASASYDRSISIWDLNQNEILRYLYQNNQSVLKVLFMPDNKSILSISSDSTVKIWDMGMAKVIEQFRVNSEMPTSLAVSNDGTMIAIGSSSGSVTLYDRESPVAPQKLITPHKSFISDLKFTSDGNWLIAGSLNGEIHKWDKISLSYDSLKAENSTIDTICITKDDLVVTLGRCVI